MANLDNLKAIWQNEAGNEPGKTVQKPVLKSIISKRANQHTKASFQYFWAAFTLQIIVYAMLSYVSIRYGHNPRILYSTITGILFYIPFTIILLDKFKKLAVNRPIQNKNEEESIYNYLQRQKNLLVSFVRFKKWYEIFLIPVSCAIGVFLVFEIYVPGSVAENLKGAIIAFIISLLSCFIAIRSENAKGFRLPIQHLNDMLDEYNYDKS